MSLKEYVVTLKNKEDLDKFYNDMETRGGPRFIPSRSVDCVERRPISRSTNYRLSDSEANLIKNDSRVLAVELTDRDQGLLFKPHRIITSSLWNKSNTVSATHMNWALLRCVEGQQRSNWGSNGTTNVSGSVTFTSTGKNVDVVIVDGNINPDHPEFAVNTDGTGGSRVVQFNWFSLNSQVTGGAAGTYLYEPYVDPSYPDDNGDGQSDRSTDNDHGAHVAGTVAGNTYGWAKDANIYNINPYGSAPSYTSYFIDYIRAWHASKPINPVTGLRNPTITNHSYGIASTVQASSINQIRYRNTIYTGPFNSAQLFSYGIDNYDISGTTYVEIPRRSSSAFEQSYIDAMNEGIIFVGSAGNEYSKIMNFSSDPADDYNNYFTVGSTTYYYARGTISAIPNFICVGSVGSLTDDSKSSFSNCGPRVDIYAPGHFINSAVNSSIGVTVGDTRNSSYRITKKSGTSMSSPQVCGLLACLAESWPRMTQTDALEYIQSFAKLNQMFDSAGGTSDYSSLQGSENRYLYYFKERQEEGQIFPKINQGLRKSSGNVWPRSKIYRYGS